MRAVKGNKEYTIDESQQKSYQDAGFDIVISVLIHIKVIFIPFNNFIVRTIFSPTFNAFFNFF